MSCGEGVHIREVACKQLTSSGYPIILHGNACSASPPPTVQKCHLKVCEAVVPSRTWDVGQWSKVCYIYKGYMYDSCNELVI